jgi:hypothetical protein
VMRIGTDLPYARAVNFGLASGGARRRMFAGVNSQMRNVAEVEMTDYVRAQLKELADELRRGAGNV